MNPGPHTWIKNGNSSLQRFAIRLCVLMNCLFESYSWQNTFCPQPVCMQRNSEKTLCCHSCRHAAHCLPWRLEGLHLLLPDECAGWVQWQLARGSMMQDSASGSLPNDCKAVFEFYFWYVPVNSIFLATTDRWALKLIKYKIGPHDIVLINIDSFNMRVLN